MKKKKFHTVSRSKLAIAFYYLQLAVMSPILIPIGVLYCISDFVLTGWGRYKDFYLKKTLHR